MADLLRPLRTARSVVRLGTVETDLVARRLQRCADVDDLRDMARRRLPGGVFDYIDGAAEDEVTLAANAAAFEAVQLVPRVLRDVSGVDPSTTVLGRTLPIPVVLAPTGFTRIAHPEGEVAVARAAAARGLPYTLSTLSTKSIEDVGAAADRPWFQVYVWRDRGLVKEMVARAAAAGYGALMVTVDTAVLGRRERDVRRGFTLPPKVGLGTLVDGLLHPAWTLDLLRSDPITFANVAGDAARDGSTAVTLSDFIGRQFDPALTWDDVDWLRAQSDLPVLVKGVGCAADARIAAAAGLPGIVVSNHGGRQLDGARATLDVLGDVVDAVGSDLEVLVDGGVRRGRDVVAACALGARAVCIGRPYLYGLAVGGERGVLHVLDQLADGVRRTMQLVGATTVAGLDRAVVHRPAMRSDP